MKIHCSTTLISALLLSLCLVTFIPGSVRFASTWRELYFEAGGFQEQNLLMPLGFYSLGLEMIGLIVLWTGYREKKCWTWFVMLIVVFFLVFPMSVLDLLPYMRTPSFRWSSWFWGIREGDWPSIWGAIGALDFLVMLVALLLPIKAFFFRSASLKAVLPQNVDNISSTGPG